MSYLYTSPTTPATGSTNLMGNLTINSPIYGYTSTSAPTSATSLVWNGTSPTWTTTATTAAHINQAGRMELKGDSADVVINGESLKETLQAIKEALRIPNRIQQHPELEEDFEEIKQLREKYEQKVKEYTEKQKVWNTLKD